VDLLSSSHEDRATVEQLLVGIARIMSVPPETLRPDDRFADLCRVQFAETEGPEKPGKPKYLFAFSYDLLDFIEKSLTDEQWNQFLSAIGAQTTSEQAILDSILNHQLADIIGFMLNAKSKSALQGA